MALFDSIRFTPGRPLTKELGSERLNAIITEIKRNKPKGERGITVRQDGTGTYIGLAASLPRGGGTSTPSTPQPWDLQARVDPDADPEDETPPYLIRVRPGTLNGILPTNWDIEEEVSGSELVYAKAVVATDGEAITGVTIVINGTAPTVQEPVEFGIQNPVEYLFGLFSEGQVYRVIGAGHITLTTEVWLVKDKASAAAPGQFPYDVLYYLND
jgi:hypothetical protein